MGGFERVDLPLPLLLQAADRRVRSSAAFGQREEPIHPLLTTPLGCAAGNLEDLGEERCSVLLLLRLAAVSSPANDSVFSSLCSLLCGSAAGSAVMSLLRRPAVCPQGHHAMLSDDGIFNYLLLMVFFFFFF